MIQVSIEKDGYVSIISIERPEVMNALSREIVDEIDKAVETIKKGGDSRCLILYSKGNFAAGADIKDMINCNEEEAKSFIFSPTYNKIANLEIPVIAAIEGYALGGGFELALTADIRIAGRKAKFGFPEVGLGIIPGAGGTYRAPKILGEANAKELIFTGRIISSSEAEKMGAVNKIVDDTDVKSEAIKLAMRISSNAPMALRAAKQMIREGIDNPKQVQAIKNEANIWASLFNTRDQKEGMKAFIDKRRADFNNQ